MADGPLGDRVVGGEVPDGPVGPHIDEEGVDLDDLARPFGLEAFGEARGVALAGGEAAAAGAGVAAQAGHGDDAASVHELAQDASDGGDRDGDAFAAQHGRELALAPHRIVGAQVLDRFDQTWRPPGLAAMVWRAALGEGGFLPAVERSPADPDGAGRLPGTEPVGHGAAPASYGVTPSLRFDIWGLRSEKARRRPSVSDNLTRQATNLHGGLLTLTFATSAWETPA